MTEAGYVFDVISPDESAEDEGSADELPLLLVQRLARQKAADVAGRVSEGIVIACDTVAQCEGKVLGKPRDRDHAREMLELLRGRLHNVHSGLCLWRRPDDVVRLRVETTRLVMDAVSDAELAAYLDTGEWKGKAGAFGYQDGLDWIHIHGGSETNVVGLPMENLARLLAELGYEKP